MDARFARDWNLFLVLDASHIASDRRIRVHGATFEAQQPVAGLVPRTVPMGANRPAR